MSNPKIIVVIGASDEATAHLRLLMRKIASQLTHQWRWGTEINADLVVVDPNEFAGQMARTRTQSSGVPCVILCDKDWPETEGLILRRPLKPENVVQVLNAAASPTIDSAQVDHNVDDFYFRALEELAPAPTAQNTTTTDIWGERRPASPTALGLDELIKGDPLAEPPPDPMQVRLTDDTTIEAIESSSLRSATRAEAARDSLHLLGEAGAPDAVPAARRAALPDTSRRLIKAYLDGDLLGGPSQAEIEGAPPLTVDPKHRMYHAEGDLSALAPYCLEPPPRHQWQVLTTAELSRRAIAPGRPYEDLLWLDALLKSAGRLAPHLDPGGSYRLKQSVVVDPEFHAHGRIAAAMQELARFNEITAAAGVRMEQVFDLVNAYDAVGYLEWKPRERFRTEPAPAPKPRSGLMTKLKWPFGKG